MKRVATSLLILGSLLGVSACAIDPNAELDQAVMEDPWMEQARRDTTPSGAMGDYDND